MAILNPEHLFEQAEALVVPPPAGPPRQVNLRRAISGAYYAVFHAVLIAVADKLVGKTKRNSPEYRLAYRSLNHRRLKELCDDVRKPTPSSKVAAYAPTGGFGQEIRALAVAVIELQQKRHDADYDPRDRVKTADAIRAIRTGRSAVERLARAWRAREKESGDGFLHFLPSNRARPTPKVWLAGHEN